MYDHEQTSMYDYEPNTREVYLDYRSTKAKLANAWDRWLTTDDIEAQNGIMYDIKWYEKELELSACALYSIWNKHFERNAA